MIDLKQRRSCLEAKKSIMIYENDTSLSPLCMLYSKEDGEWGGARPLSPEDILSLVDTEARTPRVLPEGMLWHEEGKITMWWSPKKQDKITVRGAKGTYSHPALLFMGYSNNYGPSLKVLPIENKRPTEKSAILESPYRGIDVHPKSKGMGACRVNMPNTLTLDNWWEFENAFRYSNFNYKPKPSRYLKPIGVTVKDWIDSLNLIPNGPQGL